MRRTLAIAAGGGGDAVTAAILARTLADQRDIVAIMSWSWDRLMIDPTPGPRGRNDFIGLTDHGGIAQVTPQSRLRGPGRSTLVRLAAEVQLPLLLLDGARGAVGLGEQFRTAAQVFGADELIIVDVGGDVVASGHEPGLRSPLADSLVVAGAERSGVPAEVVVTGLGLDAELTMGEARAALAARGGELLPAVVSAADAAPFGRVWDWHPSEANGMLSVAAVGWRGVVEPQRDSRVYITDDVVGIYQVSLDATVAGSLAEHLLTTGSLGDAEDRLRAVWGASEIDYERRKAASRPVARTPDDTTVEVVDRHATEAAGRGIDAVTVRRLCELTAATGVAESACLRALLARERVTQFRPPLFLTRRQPDRP
ncbi:DUF1152 domain-containing protein [Nocardia stercoris]|nr:DUF1152 domain-containing protein [Nocardia stercoris]